MIIYAPDNSVLLTVPILPESEHVEELMKTDEVRVVWNSDSHATLPEGSFVVLDGNHNPTTINNGEKYYLLEPYTPEQKKENHWKYEPVFVSFFYSLSKVPYYMYTYVGGQVTAREADWVLTDFAHNFLSNLCTAIYNETNVRYDSAVASDLTQAVTVSFNATDIISALSSIANAFETEFWLEKNPHNGYEGTIHLSFAKNTTQKNLTVGTNINVPSVSEPNEGYYNRFIGLGSTRNIPQDYQGAGVNSIAAKRLTLNPDPTTGYPNGYIDFSNGGKVYTKILQFDDIYPAATKLVVRDIQFREMYELDADTNERIPIGDGVYSMYNIWYFKLKVKNGSTYTDFHFDERTYNKDTCRDGMVLPGLVPSIHFNSGPLNGRDFEVIYHKTSGSNDPNAPGETGPFTWAADTFEIVFRKEGKYVIPDQSSLIPTADNQVVLFNVRTPQEYFGDAYDRLEAALLAEINSNYIQLNGKVPITDASGNPLRVDKNSYQFSSNPVAFNTSNPNLKIADNILYTNSGYSLSTRVTSLVTKLDYPIKQSITVGNAIIRGTLEELKEEAVSANTNINLIAALQESSQNVLDAYNRTQQMILNGLADDYFESVSTLVQLKSAYSYIGTRKGLVFDTESDPTNSPAHLMVINKGTAQNPNLALYSPLPLITGGDQIVIDGDPQGGGGGGGATMLRQLEDVYHNASGVLRKNGGSVANGDLLSFDSTGNRWVALDQSTITPDLSNYYTKTQTDTEISSAITALNLGAAATYGVGTVTSGNGGLVTGGSVYSAINEAVSSVLKMQGTTTTAISDGSTTNPVIIDGSSYTAKKGDVVMYGNKEFWWTGSAWEELGDEASWALKTTTISAGTGLTGGGTLAANRTISLSDSTIASLALADSAYQKPSTGIPQTDLASALSTKVDNGSTAYGYFSNGILPYNHGGTGISSYTKGNIIYASANNTLAKLAPNTGTKQFLTMTSSVPSWGDVDETDVFGSSAIGSSSLPVYYTGSALATITSLDLLSKNTGYIKGNRFYLTSSVYFEYDPDHGYVTLNAPFVTSGDQIVISGTPGGGGGATTLAGLDDTNITNPQAGQMLSWNGTKWVNTNAPTGSITSVSLAAGATNGTLHLVVNGTAQSDVAVTGLGSMAYKSSLAFSELSSHPTNLSGYGITDAKFGTAGSDYIPITLGSTTKNVLTAHQSLSAYLTSATAASTYQPLDADLTAIAGLSGTSGFLKKTAANTWSLDTNTYLTGINSTMVTNALGYTPANSTALADYVTLATAQTISALKTMTSGLKVSGRTNGSTGGDDEGITIGFAANGFGGVTIGNPTGVRSVFYLRNTEGAVPFWRFNNGTASFDIQHPAKSGTIALTSDIDSAIGGLDSSTEAVSSGYFITGVTITDGKITARTQSNSISGSAASLTTVSKTAWGQTYWTANGVPTNISGNMSSVGNVTPSETNSKNLGSSSLFWKYAYIGRIYLTSSVYFEYDSTHGYVTLNAPFVTSGDQIVISGTPGGGGGGGATSLWGLDDVSVPHGSSTPSNGQVLTWDSTLAKWTNKSITSGVSSVVGLTGDVTAAQISSAIGLSGYVTLAGAETISGLKTFTSGLRVSGRAYSDGDDEGIVITWASNNYATISLGSHNAERSTFSIQKTQAPKWVYNNGTAGYAITHPAKAGTIALTSDIPNVPSWAMASTKPSYTFAEITDKITHTNEFNFVPDAYDSYVYFNYRSSADTAVNVTKYIFHNGSATTGGRASVEASSFIKYGGTSAQFLKADGSVDSRTYLTGNQTITLSGDVSGSGATSISVSIGQGKVTNAMLAGSIANSKLANSSITINGSSTSLGGSFSTATITAGTAGQSTASSGLSFSVPYVTMNAYGIVTGYGTHTHTISASDLTTTIGSTTYAPYNSAGYLPLTGGTLQAARENLLKLNNTANTTNNYLQFQANGTDLAEVGYWSTFGAYLQNEHSSTKHTLNLPDAGGLYFDTYTVYHSGNSNKSDVAWACSTLTASGNIAANAGITLANNNALGGLDTGGTRRTLLALDGSNGVYLAWGAAAAGYDSYISGNNISFCYGTGHSVGMYLNSSGNIGIGTTVPAYKLDINGTTRFVENTPHIMRYYSAGTYTTGWYYGTNGNEALAFVANSAITSFMFVQGASTKLDSWTNSTWTGVTPAMQIKQNCVYINSLIASGVTPSFQLYVNGTIGSSGDQVVSSDATLKENLTPVTYSVSDIAKARAVEFDWRDGRGHSMGSIAQDWLGIAPALVHGEEGNMSLAYGQLALVNTIIEARAIESLQVHESEQDKEIRELRERVARLEMENERLRMN